MNSVLFGITLPCCIMMYCLSSPPFVSAQGKKSHCCEICSSFLSACHAAEEISLWKRAVGRLSLCKSSSGSVNKWGKALKPKPTRWISGCDANSTWGSVHYAKRYDSVTSHVYTQWRMEQAHIWVRTQLLTRALHEAFVWDARLLFLFQTSVKFPNGANKSCGGS